MRRWAFVAPLAIALAASCSSFRVDPAAPVEPAAEGGAPLPDGSSAPSDAPSSAVDAPELPAETCEGATLCEPFEDVTLEGWIKDQNAGMVSLDPLVRHSGMRSLHSSLPATPTGGGYAAGRLRRQVDTTKRGTWSTWMFLEQAALANDVNLLGVESSPVGGQSGGTVNVYLRATTSGLALYLKAAGGYERYAAGSARPPMLFGKWVEIVFEFDFDTPVVRATIDGVGSESLSITDNALDVARNRTKIDLLVGFESFFGNPAVNGWFDDVDYRKMP